MPYKIKTIKLNSIRNIIVGITALTLLSFSSFISLSANQRQHVPKFQNISLNDGLSNLSMHDFCQDDLGYIWIGTARGLNRYDGIQFEHFFYNNADSCSLYHDDIRDLFKDDDGKIYISTFLGVNCYDPEMEKMTRVKPERITLLKLVKYKTDIFGFDFEGLLYKLDKEQNTFIAQTSFQKNISFDDIVVDDETGIWAKPIDGEYLFNYKPENKLYEKFFLPDRQQLNRLDYLFKDGKDIIVATENKLYQFNIEYKVFKTVSQHLKPLIELEIAEINEISIFSNNLWITSKKNGLYIISKLTNAIKNYTSGSLKNQVTSNHVTHIFSDRDNNIWLGTFDRGIEVSYERRKNFNFDEVLNVLIDENFITSIETDFQGIYYFGTRFKGILIYNSLSRKSTILNRDNSSLQDNHIRSLYLSSDNKLWIGSERFNQLLDLKTLKFKSLNIEGFNNGLVSFCEISDKVYAGSDGQGIIRYTMNGDYLDQFDDYGNNIVNFTTKNDSAIIFSSFNRGLFEINLKNDTIVPLEGFTNINSVKKNQVITCYTDSKGNIWTGSFNQGVDKYCFENDSIYHYTMNEGLPSNDITGITEDDFGNIWISTAYGLARLDENGSFTNYSYNEGLEFIQFHQKATLKDEKGTIFFGGNFGLVYFNPATQIKDKIEAPHIILDKLKVGNHIVLPNDGTKILNKTLAKTKKITLNHRHAIFSIDYKAFDFVSANSIKYAYKLEGFDNDWNYVENRTHANYNNLSPDNYVFLVKAQNNIGKWSEEPARLEIEIKPAPWKTVWAMAGYMLLVGLILLAVFHFILRASIMKRELDIEHQERKRENEMSAMKMRFFTNISHELRTPLTLIKGNVDYLEKEIVKQDLRQLSISSLKNSTDRLLRLVNQLLSFRQLENDALDLKIRNEDLITISKDLISSFKYNCEIKQIHLSLDTEFKQLITPVDRDKYEKILFNLLNNSLKFSDVEGNIIVVIEKIRKVEAETKYGIDTPAISYIQVSVVDDGKGIAADKIPFVFDRYAQFNNNDHRPDYSGTGIGLNFTKSLIKLHQGAILVSSTENIETRFSFVFPAEIEAYSEKSTIEKSNEENKLPLLNNETTHQLVETDDQVEVGNKKVVLLAEDDIELNRFIRDQLKSKYKVITTFDGAEALKLIKNQLPDIIISDIMMPKMDGISLCKTIKEDSLTSHLPIVLLTAKAEVENQLIGLQYGADEYIVKPFDITILKARIRNLIAQRHQLQEFYKKAIPVEFKSGHINQFEINFMNQINTVIEENYKQPLFNVNIMSEKMNMSRTSFYRKFMSIADISPKEYLTKYRINKAVELIQKGHNNFGEISYMCGFNSQSIFSVLFKKEKGITPLQYKRSISSEK